MKGDTQLVIIGKYSTVYNSCENDNRNGIIEQIRQAKTAGYTSNTVYNLDGSIEIKMSDPHGTVVGGQFTPHE